MKTERPPAATAVAPAVQYDSNVVRINGTREPGDSPWLGQSPTQSELFRRYQVIDRVMWGVLGPLIGNQSPTTLAGAFLDWWTHLAASPAKQLELLHLGAEQWAKLAAIGVPSFSAGNGQADAVEPLPQDKRFSDPHWHAPPFNLLSQAFLLRQQWWERATTAVPGVSAHHEDMVDFGARQLLDVMAPSNFVATNPVLLQRTLEEGGQNLLRGATHAIEDAMRDSLEQPPAGAEAFAVGKNIAVTPGSVIYRNRLIELIQYRPTTAKTHAEPVLFIAAWIMKYYILDLSPHNSLVKWLVDHGYTVFAISWKNPEANDRDLGMADYYRLGVLDALDAIGKVMPGARTHALGYCLGGTLLAAAAAALGRARSQALRSVTLLTAQTDFSDPGELSLFIDEGQVAFLEHQMWRSGFLDEGHMKSAFQMLRSKDLVWSYRLSNYLLGQRHPASDLTAWNADTTRLPFRMHSEYLRSLFLHNALAHGEFELDGALVNLNDIRVPVFNVAALQDHIAPWRSAFKLNRLTDADQTFVLTAGGHNVGIVNPPGQTRSSYRVGHWRHGDRLLSPQEWLSGAPQVSGSWWTVWLEWLGRHSSGQRLPPAMGAPEEGLDDICAAPGTYVYQR